ncbi:MAG: hypothetical protein JST52_10415 [Bacteroidetes bacterium]|nr:hypothetical protein [Bacteroidota bacterium]MBS1739658.1 hypothetical protein [Bacteroidota bacterium]
MNGIQTFLELLKYVVPALIVLIATSVIVRRFLLTETKIKQLELLREKQDDTIRLRLHAYERLVLFIERIHPRQLVPRIYHSNMSVAELQAAIVVNIRAEFEHNLSQQIYVSRMVWDTVRQTKEQELSMVNSIASQLNPEDAGRELHKRIVDYLMTVDGQLPTDTALQIINEEAKSVLLGEA